MISCLNLFRASWLVFFFFLCFESKGEQSSFHFAPVLELDSEGQSMSFLWSLSQYGEDTSFVHNLRPTDPARVRKKRLKLLVVLYELSGGSVYDDFLRQPGENWNNNYNPAYISLGTWRVYKRFGLGWEINDNWIVYFPSGGLSGSRNLRSISIGYRF